MKPKFYFPISDCNATKLCRLCLCNLTKILNDLQGELDGTQAFTMLGSGITHRKFFSCDFRAAVFARNHALVWKDVSAFG